MSDEGESENGAGESQEESESGNEDANEVDGIEEQKGLVHELIPDYRNSPRNLPDGGNEVVDEDGQGLLPDFPQPNSPGRSEEFEGFMTGKRDLWQPKNDEEPFKDYAPPPDDLSDKSDRIVKRV